LIYILNRFHHKKWFSWIKRS